jgi:hypothetical protein
MESKPLNEIESFEPSSERVGNIVSSTSADFNPDKVGKVFSPSTTDKAWQEYIEPVFDVLGKIPESLGSFFSDYQKPLVTLGLILTAIVSVKVILAVLDAIGDIPLLGSLSQLVGLGYIVWFVYRYLWKAENRRELSQEFEALKHQIFGRHD